MRRYVLILSLLVVFFGACSDDPAMESGSGTLIDHYRWQSVSQAEDLFALPMIPSDECVAGEGYLAEVFGQELVFSVSTGECARVTVEQPILVNLPAGTWVEGRLWHFALSAESPAAGWAAFAVEERVVWEQAVEIPAESGLIRIHWQAPRDIFAGEMLRFHVQNHGDNSWHLIDLNVQQDAAD